MTLSEFTDQTSNEAIQCNLIMFRLRDELNRMAPWDCTTRYANLNYITSLPTTPENSAAGPPMWQPGTPAPPYAYEYQYPADCQRARFIMPQYTALAGGVPIYPSGTATGSNLVGWTGPALKFKVSTDQFYAATAASIVNPGTGFALGDLIWLTQPSFTFTQQYPPLTNQLSPQTVTMNVGCPAQLQVTGIGAGGAITSVVVVNQVYGEPESPSGGTTESLSGSYFSPPTGTIAMNFAQGQNGEVSNGTGATFTLTLAKNAAGTIITPAPQRVILCNQENAILCYNRTVDDPNIMDVLFQDAWIAILAARLAFQLSGNVALANEKIALANNLITEARKADGNEGITVNDVTPDFLRIRGNWGGPNWEYSPNMSFDWGSFWSPY